MSEERHPIECDCGQGDPAIHEICSVCGDDWPDCSCVAIDTAKEVN
jgi:hypothetical protein